MPSIFLETERGVDGNGYDLFRVVIWGDGSKEAAYEHNEQTVDRLRAAILNTGYACRYAADNALVRSTIQLKSDTDGKDYRYSNEHNILCNLLNPSSEGEARKHRALYGDYLKYLVRIRELMREWQLYIEIAD